MITVVGFFVWILGLCVGSFLNVVVYRLPRDLSVAEPRWSFCPTCQRTLSWIENLPLLSWLLQRGRCRGCDKPIAAQYPLVEASTGLTFAVVYHLLFVTESHALLSQPMLPADTPLLLAWLVFASVLVATSAMDIVAYMVDVRVVDLATLGGVVCLAAWGRTEVTSGIDPAWAAAGSAALILCAARLYLFRGPAAEYEPEEDPPAREDSTFGPGILLLLVALVGGSVLCVLPASVPDWNGLSGAGLIGIALLLFAIVAAVAPPRDADDEIHEAIEEEAPEARRMVLHELLWLLPAIVAGAGAFALVRFVPSVAEAFSWAPLAGASYAMAGASIAAAVGWAVRIGFTLAFGKEAFGTGDIYLLAAAGACAGWEIALLGFLFAVGVALVLWLLLLLSKPAAMIAFVPPLSIGFLVALLAYEPARVVAGGYVDQIEEAWRRDPRIIALFGGFLVVATGFSIVLARLLRGVLAPSDTRD